MAFLERPALQGFLLVLTVFELFSIHGHLPSSLGGQGGDLSGMGSNLSSGDPERRLWCFMLSLLIIARVSALASPSNPAILANCAAVHVVELVYMGGEYLFYGCDGETFIFCFIVFDAVLFTVVYLHARGEQSAASSTKKKKR